MVQELNVTESPEESSENDDDAESDDDDDGDTPDKRKRQKNGVDHLNSSEQQKKHKTPMKADERDPPAADEKSTQEYANDIDLAASALEASHNNALLIKTLFDKVGELNVGSETAIAELKAIRSVLVTKKKGNEPKDNKDDKTSKNDQKKSRKGAAASVKTSDQPKVKLIKGKNVAPKVPLSKPSTTSTSKSSTPKKASHSVQTRKRAEKRSSDRKSVV